MAVEEDAEILSNQADEGEKKDSQRSCLYTGLGYAATTVDVLFTCTSVMCAQALGGLVPPFELNGWRYTAQFIIVVPVIIFKRLNIFLERREVLWLLLVACCCVLFNFSFYTAATYLPVGTIGGAQSSLVILICALVTAALDRKCACSIMIACIVCIAGVLLVTQPPFLFNESGPTVYHPLCGPRSAVDQALADNTSFSHDVSEIEKSLFNSSMESGKQGEHVAVGMGYLCLLCSTIVVSTEFFIVKRRLSQPSAFVISFWVSLIGIASQFLIMAIVEKPVLPKTPTCIVLLLSHAFCAAVGSVSLKLGGQLISPDVTSLLLSQDVVVLFVAQYTILRAVYPGRENWMEFVGAGLVLVGNVVNPAVEIWNHRRQKYKQMN